MMPSVMIDVDYNHFSEDRNITERTTQETRGPGITAHDAIQLLDQAYSRARARLIDSLPAEQVDKVTVVVMVPEYALARVQKALGEQGT